MNIGIVTTWFERGAAYVSKQYMDLLQPENSVFIYAREGDRPSRDSVWNGTNIYWGKKPVAEEYTEIDLKDFDIWLKKSNIDIVFFNEQQHWDVVAYCMRKPIKTGAYIDYYTELTIPLFEAYDFLICNTKRHYEAFSWHPKCYYVSWGTDTELFAPQLKPPETDEIAFFHSAGMNPFRKGTDFVLKAFEDEYINQNSKLIVHSQKDLKEFFPELISTLNCLQKKGCLTVIHSTIGAPGLYHLGDVYLYPSRLDGIGLTIAEALSCGLPVIVPDQPPMNEFINETCGQTIKVQRQFARADGYYWPQCMIDVDDFRSRIKSFINNKHSLRSMQLNARKHAEEKLCWKKHKNQLLGIFRLAAAGVKNTKKITPNEVYNYEKSKKGNFLKLYRKYPLIYRIKKALFP